MSTQTPGSTLPPCEMCGGSQVGNLSVKSQYYVGAHPRNKAFLARPLTGLNLVACLDCGYAKLFVDDLHALRKETSEKPENFRW